MLTDATQVLQNETDTTAVKFDLLPDDVRIKPSVDSVAKFEFRERAHDDDHRHENHESEHCFEDDGYRHDQGASSSTVIASTVIAKDEMEASCWKPTQKNNILQEQCVKHQTQQDWEGARSDEDPRRFDRHAG